MKSDIFREIAQGDALVTFGRTVLAAYLLRLPDELLLLEVALVAALGALWRDTDPRLAVWLSGDDTALLEDLHYSAGGVLADVELLGDLANGEELVATPTDCG